MGKEPGIRWWKLTGKNEKIFTKNQMTENVKRGKEYKQNVG